MEAHPGSRCWGPRGGLVKGGSVISLNLLRYCDFPSISLRLPDLDQLLLIWGNGGK